MDWHPVDETAQDGLEDVKAKLLMLGFPEEVLNDLTPVSYTHLPGAPHPESEQT